MSQHHHPPHIDGDRVFPERSTGSDRSRALEQPSLNNPYYGASSSSSSTKQQFHHHNPSNALAPRPQTDPRATYNSLGYPVSPRRRDRPSEELGLDSDGSNAGGGAGGYIQTSFPQPPSKLASSSSSPSNQSHAASPVSPQDQLERLAVEASTIAGIPLRSDSPQQYDSGVGGGGGGGGGSGASSPHSSVSRSLSGSSIKSVHGSSRDRLQTLLSVPELASSSASAPPSISLSMSAPNLSRTTPRTSSIDSAISSLSSQSIMNPLHNSHNSPDAAASSSASPSPSPHKAGSATTTTTGSSPADIQGLIQAAGSPEALIQYMLKEKASAAAQNTQLWRLVDKQRAMILGLNKDLERALKDKERYRKKLNEHLGVIPPMPQTASATTMSSGLGSNSPEPSLDELGREDDRALHPNGSIQRSESMPLPERERPGSASTLDISIAPYPVTPPGGNPDDRSSSSHIMKAPDQRMPSPTAHLQSMPSSGVGTPESVRTPSGSQHSDQSLGGHSYRNPPLSPMREESHHGLKVDVEMDSQAPQNIDSPVSPDINMELRPKPKHKKLGICTAVSPATGLGKSPMRKAPPAPLALSPQHDLKLHSETEDDDDDDDDDNVSIDEIAGYKRIMEAKEGRQQRNGSSSQAGYESDNSWQMTPDDKKGPLSSTRFPSIHDISGGTPSRPAPSPMPSVVSERQRDTASPTSPTSSASTSLRIPNMKDPLSSVSPGIRQQFARVPAKSPGLPGSPRGLPTSPRPIDRPMNSPMPRRATMSPEIPGSPRPRLQMSPTRGVSSPFLPGTPRMSMPPSTSMPLQSPHPFLGKGHDRNVSTSSLPNNTHHHHKSNSSGDGGSSGSPPLLIQPSAIASVDSRVVSSRMRPSRASVIPSKARPIGEDSVFTLGVFSRATGKEILRVEKDVGALPALDVRLRKYISYSVTVPDKALFTGHAPSRVDARRSAVDEYFAGVLGATMDERAALALCEFFSVDVVDTSFGSDAHSLKEGHSNPSSGNGGKATKEGYLTKRGKNFGGWKARYFILDGPILKYYESPGGPHLGQIKLSQAQIGRQSQNQKKEKEKEKEKEEAEDTESQYRHAFLVLEPKRKDSSTLVRHVLCAESDLERDEWVDALLQYVDKGDSNDDAHSTNSKGSVNSGRDPKKRRQPPKVPEKPEEKDTRTNEEKLQALSYEQTSQGAEPARGPTPEELNRQRASPSSPNSSTTSLQPSQHSTHAPSPSPAPDRSHQKPISGPVNGSVISDLAAWGASKLAAPNHHEQQTQKQQKKRSIWGFRQRSSSDLTSQLQYGSVPNGPERIPMSRTVFGASLEEAVHLTKPPSIEEHLPAVVYRCIEYLDAKDASNEEGIFRLSGSNVVIKGLKERFNTESDFNLLANDEYYDVHAIAGLLKLYLRELPTNVLTSERREDFVKVTEMDDKGKKIVALNNLVHSLPIENFALLKALSCHLIRIVDNSDVNKMTIRNVGIVFSPTLNIPAQVFSMFLHEYKQIFHRGGELPPPDTHNDRGSEPESRPTLSPKTVEQLKPPITPGLVSPHYLPNLAQQQQTHTQQQQQASYEPTYEQTFPRSPLLSQASLAFPPPAAEPAEPSTSISAQPPPAPPPQTQQQQQQSAEQRSGKARRRESSMMFMMGGMRKNPFPGRSGGGNAMVMEDSVYE